ncbi:thioredoxin family protein [Salipaludibacillus keqinensis]|uniref:Thioredoxin family protein n=2 Tax=Salipaludibacillus keqinensis TaxID=2045207 RepID=A0A323TMD0_9BACI|nr:thioredoxin family protein [Salipaludibacillus keqinensis]
MPFKTVVDTENKLSSFFGMKIIPNGIFIDENGIIRLIKQGFHVTNEEHVEALEDLITEKVDTVTLDDVYYEPIEKENPLEIELAITKFKLAMELMNQHKRELALKELDEALRYDPDNFLIRKQRWYIRYPEKFEPTIDIEWQNEQLKKERDVERDDCGPEGCRIPGSN